MKRALVLALLFVLACGCVQETPRPETTATPTEPPATPPPPLEEEVPVSPAPTTAAPPPQTAAPETRPPLEALPECSGQKLTVPLVDVAEIYSISPLGNLNPPEHTLPTQHMYLHLNSAGVELRAPGDLKITTITSNMITGDESMKDYGMTLALCEDVFIYFLHIKELSPELAPLLEGADCSSQGRYEHCYNNLPPHEHYDIKAGELIGKVASAEHRNFDFGAYDHRHRNEFVNPERYPSRGLYIICPLDLYESPVREELYDKLERTKAPRCGTVMHDAAGTLKGNWFNVDLTADSPDIWGKELSFADNNFDSPEAVISVGGVITGYGKWELTPAHSGRINRAFDEVTPDGNIYCYEGARQSGRIIVQLETETTLKIEHQDGSCGANTAFTDPTYYSR